MSSQKTTKTSNSSNSHNNQQLQQESIHQFQQAVTFIFNSWTALKIAVEMQWGGIDSSDKCDWFMNMVIDHFLKSGGKEPHVDDLESILDQIMADEFNTLLEDDSAYQVSQHLIKLYNECMQGNYSNVEKLRLKQSTKNVSNSARRISNGDEEDNSSSSGEGDSEDDSEDGNSNEEEEKDGDIDKMEVDHVIDKPAKTKNEPIIDEEGFQLVTRRKR
ncbi:hypothetical protein Glove_454g17 [Diversispora epigaea]|uniref:Pre-rRNA-processing protein TSR2 n=1 Tax=Diversispora epigaea TaxID=1348612 RepID=A0A397GRN5_9GLOM|nr:hypothetical protein Glove_454g17 [Diversispora epigaea]